jgi:hypothetical protein
LKPTGNVSRMAVDPLSPATRAAKRNLLSVSVAAITYRAFDVSISRIPLGGLEIAFDNRVFAFLLLVLLLYLIATFALYYFIDIRNIEKPVHLVEKEKNHAAKINGFWTSHAAFVGPRRSGRCSD